MYLLFAGEEEYNEGGMSDLVGVFRTLEDAQKKALDNEEHNWAEVALVEGDTIKVVSVLYDDMGGIWDAPRFGLLFTIQEEEANAG